MSELPRRLKNRRRTGTGRITTDRAHIDTSIQRGKRTGLEIDFRGLSKVDGFQLPGTFFDSVNIPSKYKISSDEESSDSTSQEEDEEERYFERVQDLKKITKEDEITPKKVSRRITKTTTPSATFTTVKDDSLLEPQISPILKVSPKMNISAEYIDTPKKKTFVQDSFMKEDTIEPDVGGFNEEVVDEDVQMESVGSSIGGGREMGFPSDEDVNDEQVTPPSSKKQLYSKSKNDNVQLKKMEPPKRSPISSLYSSPSSNYSQLSYDSIDNSNLKTPNRHIAFDDITPVKYREYPTFSEPSPEVDYYDHVYSEEEKEDGSFHVDEISENENVDDSIILDERPSRINLRKKTIKPLAFWEGERPDTKNDELIGKKKYKTPRPEIKTTKNKLNSKKRKIELDDNFGKYRILKQHPTIEDKVIETTEQILQTKESLTEERFHFTKEDEQDDEDDENNVDLKITVAFSDEKYKSGTIEIEPNCIKPNQYTREFNEIFYCLSGTAELKEDLIF
eukprot:gene10569-3088_t